MYGCCLMISPIRRSKGDGLHFYFINASSQWFKAIGLWISTCRIIMISLIELSKVICYRLVMFIEPSI